MSSISNYRNWKKTQESATSLAGKVPAQLEEIRSGSKILRLGDSGEAVRTVQARLKQEGFLTQEPTGSYDEATHQAVKRFQSTKNLIQDGLFGPKTYAALFGETAKESKIDPKEVFIYLRKKMSFNHTMGIMSNIARESSFNPAAIGDHGTSGGLFQHHASRLMALKQSLGGGDAWKKNWTGQIDFALSEPAGKEYLRKQFASPHEASEWWTRNFEKPANVDQEVSVRKGLMKNVAANIKKGLA